MVKLENLINYDKTPKLATFMHDSYILFQRYILGKECTNYLDLTSKERIEALRVVAPFHFCSEDEFKEYSNKNQGFPLGLCVITQNCGEFVRVYNDIPHYIKHEKNPLVKNTVPSNFYPILSLEN